MTSMCRHPWRCSARAYFPHFHSSLLLPYFAIPSPTTAAAGGGSSLWPSKVLPSFAGVFIAPVTEGWPGWVYLAWWLVSHLKYMCSESHVVGQIWYTCNCWNFSIFMPPKDLCLPHPQGGRRGTAGWYVWCDLILRLLTVTQTRVGPNLMFFTAVPACARQ